MFRGEVVALEPEFATDAAVVVLRALDRSHRLQRARHSRTFQQMTASDIVAQVCAASGIPLAATATSVVHEFVQQSMESDWDFCRRLAHAEGLAFGMDATGLFLRAARRPTEARPSSSGARTCARSSPAHRRPAARAGRRARLRPRPQGGGDRRGVGPQRGPGRLLDDHDRARHAFGDAELLVSDRVGTSQAEVAELAQATLDRLASGFFEAEGVVEGDPP